MSNEEQTQARDELLQKGLGYIKAGDHRAAHAVADRLLDNFEATPESLVFAGEVQLLLGNFAEVEALADRCIETFPSATSNSS